jgi:hypothetical protein
MLLAYSFFHELELMKHIIRSRRINQRVRVDHCTLMEQRRPCPVRPCFTQIRSNLAGCFQELQASSIKKVTLSLLLILVLGGVFRVIRTLIFLFLQCRLMLWMSLAPRYGNQLGVHQIPPAVEIALKFIL